MLSEKRTNYQSPHITPRTSISRYLYPIGTHLPTNQAMLKQ